VSELLEILTGLKSDLLSSLTDEENRKHAEANFDRMIELAELERLKNDPAYLRGKIEAYETVVNALAHNFRR